MCTCTTVQGAAAVSAVPFSPVGLPENDEVKFTNTILKLIG